MVKDAEHVERLRFPGWRAQRRHGAIMAQMGITASGLFDCEQTCAACHEGEAEEWWQTGQRST